MTTAAQPRVQGSLTLAAAGATVLLWASSFVGIREVGAELSAGPFALLRLLVGSVGLGLLVVVSPKQELPWRPMLVHIAPLLIALLAGLTLGEGFPRSVVLGSLVAFGGVALIGLSTSSGRAGTWGVLLCVLAAVAYAVGVVAQKPLLARLPAAQVTWIACMMGPSSACRTGPRWSGRFRLSVRRRSGGPCTSVSVRRRSGSRR